MRIAVIGAAGKTGQHVVEQALAQGNDVIALARNPERIPSRHDNLHIRSCDVRDRVSLVEATKGVDALVSALGTGSSREATDVYSAGVQSELDVMRQNGVGRLAVISAAPAGPRDEQPFLERRIAMPLLERFFGALYDDMRRMESILDQSTLSWTALRPPRLVDKPATGSYRIDTRPLPKARTLTYPDLATALLDCLKRDDLSRRAAYVAN
jgi:putative NADH-flavin reductase